jgi:hypothetical protein
MELICPRCGSRSNELMECDACSAIGCIRCMKKSYGKWICYKCEVPERRYPVFEETSNAFSAMFG